MDNFEDDLKTLKELEADLTTVQKAVYAQLSKGRTMAEERIFVIKTILSDYKYEVNKNV